MKLKPVASPTASPAAPLAAPLAAASLTVLLVACGAEEGVGQPTVESERIEEIPADVAGVDPDQVEADANEMVPAPTVEGATEDLAIDVDEVARADGIDEDDEIDENAADPSLDADDDVAAAPVDPVDPVDPIDPDGDVLERDPAPEIEAVSAEASEEASEVWRALQANWEEALPDVRDHFAELDETRLRGTGGDRGALVSLVALGYDVDPDEAERRVAEFEATR